MSSLSETWTDRLIKTWSRQPLSGGHDMNWHCTATVDMATGETQISNQWSEGMAMVTKDHTQR